MPDAGVSNPRIQELIIATLNCRGLNTTKFTELGRIVKKQNVHLLCMQETHDQGIQEIETLQNILNMKLHQCKGRNMARGTIIGVKNTPALNVTDDAIVWDEEGNLEVLEIKWNDGETFTLANLYAQNDDRSRRVQFRELNHSLYMTEELILVADWNMVEDPDSDRAGCDRNRPYNLRGKGARELAEIKDNYNLVDSYREIFPNGRMYTFRGQNNYRARLDRIYIPRHYRNRTEIIGLEGATFSDHDMFCIKIRQADYYRLNEDGTLKKMKNAVWKYNKQILENEAALKEFEEMWKEWIKEKMNYVDPLKFWDHSKNKIVKWLQNKGKKMKEQKNKKVEELRNELNYLIRDEGNNNQRISNIKTEILKIEEEKLIGAEVRAKVQWRLEGERPTRFFFNIEQENQKKTVIHRMKNAEGESVAENDGIKEILLNFYEDLYTNVDTDPDAMRIVLDNIHTTVREEDVEKMTAFFNHDEIRKMVMNLAKNKSPGVDGLTSEFYQQTWHIIGREFTTMINNAYLRKDIPFSMRQGLICLIYKEKGDEEDPKQWRPLTLLPTDYKILTRLANGRISPVLKYLISKDQACAVNGRDIADQLILLSEMIQYMYDRKQSGLIISLDLEKAYDLINHQYLREALKKYQFPKVIIDWISGIYSKMSSQIKVNNELTKSFHLTRSIRQGDPISTTLFVLAIEPLAEMIRRNIRIDPIRLPNTQDRKVVQYADDTSVCTCTATSYEALMETVAIFEKGAGARLNRKKTEVLILQYGANIDVSKIPEENRKNAIKMLGMWFGEGSMEKNCKMLREKVQKTIKRWNRKVLSFQGKVTILRTSILPKIYYIMRIIKLPDNFLQEMETVARDFIWSNDEMPKIQYKMLQNKWCDGGINAPDYKLEQKAILAVRLVKVQAIVEPPWLGLLVYRLGISLRNDFPRLNEPNKTRTLVSSETNDVIKTVYFQLKPQITSWEKETFKNIKQLLYKVTKITEIPERVWTTTWINILNSTPSRTKRDVNYLIAIRRLLIGEVWKRRRNYGGIQWRTIGTNTAITGDGRFACKLCDQRNELETFEHLFIECNNVQQLKLTVEAYLNKALTDENILYHEGLSSKHEHETITNYKSAILAARSKKRVRLLTTAQETELFLLTVFEFKQKCDNFYYNQIV